MTIHQAPNASDFGNSSLKITHWAGIILLAHIIFWTIPALLWRTSAPMDVTEAFVYSLQWQWGYEKDPYLVTFFVMLARWLTHNHFWLTYFFSQFAVLATFAAVWRLARLLGLSPRYALASVLCLQGIIYYNFATPQFNDNVLMLPFWAWSCVVFYQAMQTQRWRYWLGLGLFAGLGLMSKYSMGLLIFSMLLYLILTQHGRKSWRLPGVYVGIIACILIVLPNIIWLFQHDFATLHYAFDRASIAENTALLDHIIYPVKFIGAQLAIILPALLLLVILCGKNRFKTAWLSKTQWQCLLFISVLPIMLTALCSVVTGAEILTRWGTPFFSLSGIVVLSLWRPVIEQKRWYYFVAAVIVVFYLMVMVYTADLVFAPRLGANLRAVFPGHYLAKQVTRRWNRHFHNKPLLYVDGDRWITGNISVFSVDHPIALPYFSWDSPVPGTNLQVSATQLKKGGILYLWRSTSTKKHPKAFLSVYPQAIFLGYIPFRYEHYSHKITQYVGVAAVAPKT